MMVYIDQDFASIVPRYLKNIENQVLKIDQLLKHNKFKEIERLSIQIRDSGENYGFLMIGQLGLQLIFYSGLEASAKIKSTITAILDYINNCEIKYIEL